MGKLAIEECVGVGKRCGEKAGGLLDNAPRLEWPRSSCTSRGPEIGREVLVEYHRCRLMTFLDKSISCNGRGG